MFQIDKSFRKNIKYPEIRNNVLHPKYDEYKHVQEFEDIWDGKRSTELYKKHTKQGEYQYLN